MAKASSSETSIKERRLRPVYDLLDGCNNKRAVQEVDRLLRKQPNFTCAKVLKALALLRMNKPQECLAIITPIVEDSHLEDNTLQALSICYRELDQPEMVCQLYENACKVEQSEDMMTHCFLAYVRIGDFQNQYQAAMKLYKLHKKGPYFCWAIMSLVAQAIQSPSSSSARVSLPLAERMMTKFIDESKHETEKEMALFTLILQKQRNYTRLLEILENTVKPTISAVTGLYHQLKIECLQETQQWEILAQYLESSILGRPNEWQYYSEYVSLIESIGETRVNSFLRKALDLYRSEIPPKSTLLALFFLYDKVAKKDNFPKTDGFTLIELYLKHYGHKASCFMDIAPFLRAVPLNEFTKSVPAPCSVTAEPFNVHNLRRETNYLYLTRALMTVDKSNVLANLEKCQNLVQTYTTVRNRLTQQELAECSALVELIKLGAFHLLDSFWSDGSNWTGAYKLLQAKSPSADVTKCIRVQSSPDDNSNCSRSIQKQECAQNDTVSNGLIQTKTQYRIEEKDFPVLVCSSILAYALEECSSSAQIRLILAKLYIRLGAIGPAMDTLQTLDFKYIQFESVGYIYIWKLAHCGFLNDGFRTLKAAETFYGVYQKESIEHILSAYKYGAWTRILEFAKFRKRLLNSVQSYLVRFESKLLEYCRDGCSHSQILQIKQSGSYCIGSIPWDELTDGRDSQALKDFTANQNVQQWKEITFKAEKQRLKIRGLLLMLMDDAVGFMQEDNAVNKEAALMVNKIKRLQDETNVDLKQFMVKEAIPINGMWPPRIAQYVQFGHIDVLLNYFLLICNVVHDTPSTWIGETVKKIVNFFNVKLIREIRAADQWPKSLFEVSDYFQNTYDLLETLGFACILTDVLSYILNKELNLKEKSKKKKGKATGVHATHFQTFLCLQSSIRNCYMELSYQISRHILSVQSEYSNVWEDVASFFERSLGRDLHHILSSALPTVLTKIQESYAKSLEEMSNNIKSKLKYLNSLHVQQSS